MRKIHLSDIMFACWGGLILCGLFIVVGVFADTVQEGFDGQEILQGTVVEFSNDSNAVLIDVDGETIEHTLQHSGGLFAAPVSCSLNERQAGETVMVTKYEHDIHITDQYEVNHEATARYYNDAGAAATNPNQDNDQSQSLSCADCNAQLSVGDHYCSNCGKQVS